MPRSRAMVFETQPFTSVAKSVSSGTTTTREPRGRYPLYGSTGQISRTDRSEFTGPSILVARVGANAGSVYVVDGSYGVTDNTLVVRLSPGHNQSFFAQYLEHAELNRMVYGSGQPLVTGSMLKSLDVPAVVPAEQARVAGALDDVDRLITTLERLIAKKQAIKQGMLQELLSGQTRLPGFAGEWSPVLLKDEGGTYGGLTGKAKGDFGSGGARYVTFMEVISGVRLLGRRLERVRVRSGERQNSVRRGDVLFNGSSETPEEVALAAVVDFNPDPSTFLNSFCFGYRLKSLERIDPAYLAYFFRSAAGREVVSVLAQGATRYNIAKTKLMLVAPSLPPLDEQQAIVNVLSDVEVEIDALAKRLDKVRAIKRGMRQQLLTGRVRLPMEAAA